LVSVVSLYVSFHSRLDVGASRGEFIARGRKAVIVSMQEISAVRVVLELLDITISLVSVGLRIRLFSLYTKGLNHPSRNKQCRGWLHLMVEPVFWIIMGSLVVVPLLWIFIRKQNSTDREGREPPVLSKSLT
jgi:hypothetical protein